MKKLLGIVVLGLLIGCSDDSSTSNKISLGSEVYYNFCSSCHDTGMGPNLDFNTLKFSEIVYKVTYGGGGMPSFKNILTENEIETVAYYIFKTK
jgi:mono/diheme cytochrome c family protein|tara:strand:+ start:231 stop:512 length:282 start_codon:yes stop_codon:yes gene_type:complete